MKSYPFVISCDWFAYSCSSESGHLPNLGDRLCAPNSPDSFVICESPEHHPLYESSALAMLGRAPIAHLFYRCKRQDQPHSCQLKVDNSRLYYGRWREAVKSLVAALGWIVMRINRIDVCCDFNYFVNGRVPIRFCQDYLRDPTTERPSFIRHSSNKVRAVLTRRLSCVDYHTLSWGTRDSAVQTNLYNKSLELAEKVNKPWILERWAQSGIIHDPNGELTGQSQFVWRLEFSINPAAVCFKSLRPADVMIRELSIDDVATAEDLLRTFRALLPAYFTFHILSKEAAEAGLRVRQLPIVTLFNLGALDDPGDCVLYKPVGLRYWRKSTRSDRLFINKMLDAYEQADMTCTERDAFQIVISKLLEMYNDKRDVLRRVNLADDVAEEWLKDAMQPHGKVPLRRITSQRSISRAASRWVRMLKGAHDDDLARFAEALMYLESLEDTDAFQSCVRFAEHFSAGLMPDEAISQWVDEDADRAAYEDMLQYELSADQDMLLPTSATTPRNAEDVQPQY